MSNYFDKRYQWLSGKYTDPRCLRHIRLNTGVYVGGGGSGASCKVKVPKLNASKKIWKTFYKMFPYFKELAQSSGYIAKADNWVLVRLKPFYRSALTGSNTSMSVVKIRTDII